MPVRSDRKAVIAEELRRAFATRDLEALGSLLAQDARWGDDDHPRRCRGRAAVLATFDRLLREGVRGEVTDTVVGRNGVAVRLHVRWPERGDDRGASFYHSCIVTNGLVSEIQRHDDRGAAVEAIR